MTDPTPPESGRQHTGDAKGIVAQPLDYRQPVTPKPGASDAVPWFGYIAVGIVLASMLLGFLALVAAVIWLLR